MSIRAISARNVITGRVTDLRKGTVAAQVVLDIGGGNAITSTVTVDSVERLGLQVGSEAAAVVKASDVLIAVMD